jgi:hypothetical protein
MDFLQSFDKYSINEAVAMKDVRKYVHVWQNNGGRERYSEWFDGKWRIYLDIVSAPSDIQLQVEEVLDTNGYIVVDYFNNTAKKKGENRTYKLGRLLQRFDKTLNSLYANDKDVTQDDNMKVVISRHPYDVLGMSTDRRWNSCMNFTMKYGDFATAIFADVKIGTLVAYVINKEDTNINDPINRLLIKPYHNSDKTKTLLATDNKVYYNTKDKEVLGFRETVDKWLDSKQGEIDGRYDLDDSLYNDGKPVAYQNDKKLNLLKKRYKCNVIERDGYLALQTREIDALGNAKHGLADMKGNVILEPIYKSINVCVFDGQDMAAIQEKQGLNKWAIFNITKKTFVTNFIYHSMHVRPNGFKVEDWNKSSTSFVVDVNGNRIEE